MFNAEFQRNLWLEFSPLRLIAAPAIIAILIGLVFAIGDDSVATGVTFFESGTTAAYALLYVWGGWLAAGAVLGEINAQTWELQRMSALGAWAMSWGKLLGATAYIWYIAALLVGVALLGQSMGGAFSVSFDGGLNMARHPEGLLWLPDLILSSLLVQSAAFTAGLLLAGKIRTKRRGPVLAAWVMGMAAGGMAGFLTGELPQVTALLELGNIESVYWFDGRYRIETFGLASLVLFVAFATFAGYRLMRRELQFHSLPWGLPLFVVMMTLYITGFPAARLTPDDSFLGLVSLIAFAVVATALYLSAFLDRNDPIRYRSLMTAVANRRWREALVLTPWWVPQYALGVLAAIGVLLFSDLQTLRDIESLMPAEIEQLIFGQLWAPAFLALALRDIGFLLWINMSGRYKRPDVSALVYLALFYGPVQALAHLTGFEEPAAAFFITPGTSPVVTIFGGLALAAVFLGLAVRGAKGRQAPVAGRRAARKAAADGDTRWNG